MNDNFNIEPLQWAEIQTLKGFAPTDWNFDLTAFLYKHFGKDYFLVVVAKVEDRIIAIGNGMFNGNTGWAGNIIVDKKYRRQGIGSAITRYLVDEFVKRKCSSILLIATNSGMQLYYKMGFKTSTQYSFYTCPCPLEWNNDGYIRKIRKTDHEKILALDRFFPGEDRRSLLLDFIEIGWVFVKKDISGFYLPDFGAGFIAANNVEAGLSLLRFKLSKPGQIVVIPEENFFAVGFLEQTGCIKTLSAPRMYLSEETTWHPEMIYSRAAGYCG